MLDAVHQLEAAVVCVVLSQLLAHVERVVHVQTAVQRGEVHRQSSQWIVVLVLVLVLVCCVRVETKTKTQTQTQTQTQTGCLTY